MALSVRRERAHPRPGPQEDPEPAVASSPGSARATEKRLRLILLAPHQGYLHLTHVTQRLLECEEVAVDLLPFGRSVPPGTQPVVVAPSTAHGLLAATRMVSSWHSDVKRPILLVVRDAPLPVPPIVAHRIRTLKERVAAVLDLPYLVDLRTVDDPYELVATSPTRRRPPRALRRIQRLRTQLIRLLPIPHEDSR